MNQPANQPTPSQVLHPCLLFLFPHVLSSRSTNIFLSFAPFFRLSSLSFLGFVPRSRSRGIKLMKAVHKSIRCDFVLRGRSFCCQTSKSRMMKKPKYQDGRPLAPHPEQNKKNASRPPIHTHTDRTMSTTSGREKGSQVKFSSSVAHPGEAVAAAAEGSAAEPGPPAGLRRTYNHPEASLEGGEAPQRQFTFVSLAMGARYFLDLDVPC